MFLKKEKLPPNKSKRTQGRIPLLLVLRGRMAVIYYRETKKIGQMSFAMEVKPKKKSRDK